MVYQSIVSEPYQADKLLQVCAIAQSEVIRPVSKLTRCSPSKQRSPNMKRPSSARLVHDSHCAGAWLRLARS